MKEADVDAAKDAAYKSCEVGFSDDFPFLHFFEAKGIGVQESLVFRVDFLFSSVKEMQQGSVVVAYGRRRGSRHDFQDRRMLVK